MSRATSFCVASLILVTGCVNVGPVVPADDDTFVVYAVARGGTVFNARRNTHHTAVEHCAKMGRVMEVVSTTVDSGGGMDGFAELTFRCVPPDGKKP